jgi:hypothetical protein
MRGILTLALVLIFVAGCAHRKVGVKGNNRVVRPGVVSMWTPWVKDKGDTYDMNLTILNESGKMILIYPAEAHCFRGATEGSFKNLGNGERIVDFSVGQKREFTIHCDFDSYHHQGDYRVVLSGVYATTADGKGTPKQLAKNLELVIPESSLK